MASIEVSARADASIERNAAWAVERASSKVVSLAAATSSTEPVMAPVESAMAWPRSAMSLISRPRAITDSTSSFSAME